MLMWLGVADMVVCKTSLWVTLVRIVMLRITYNGKYDYNRKYQWISGYRMNKSDLCSLVFPLSQLAIVMFKLLEKESV